VETRRTAAGVERLRRVERRGRFPSARLPRQPGTRDRNATNPRIGCGAQQTRRTHDGGNRQGGGKPRRRNRTGSLARAGRSEAEPKREPRWNRAGVDVERPDRWRGIFGNPKRGAWRSPGKDERKASRDADSWSLEELLRQPRLKRGRPAKPLKR